MEHYQAALVVALVVLLQCDVYQARSCRNTVIRIGVPGKTNITIKYPPKASPVKFVPYPYHANGDCYICTGFSCRKCKANDRSTVSMSSNNAPVKTNIIINLKRPKHQSPQTDDPGSKHPSASGPRNASSSTADKPQKDETIVVLHDLTSATGTSSSFASTNGDDKTATSSSSAASTTETKMIGTFVQQTPTNGQPPSYTENIYMVDNAHTHAESAAESSVKVKSPPSIPQQAQGGPAPKFNPDPAQTIPVIQNNDNANQDVAPVANSGTKPPTKQSNINELAKDGKNPVPTGTTAQADPEPEINDNTKEGNHKGTKQATTQLNSDGLATESENNVPTTTPTEPEPEAKINDNTKENNAPAPQSGSEQAIIPDNSDSSVKSVPTTKPNQPETDPAQAVKEQAAAENNSDGPLKQSENSVPPTKPSPNPTQSEPKPEKENNINDENAPAPSPSKAQDISGDNNKDSSVENSAKSASAPDTGVAAGKELPPQTPAHEGTPNDDNIQATAVSVAETEKSTDNDASHGNEDYNPAATATSQATAIVDEN